MHLINKGDGIVPSTNKTPMLGLSQWVENDTPTMDDLNADNRIMDREIQSRTIYNYRDITLFASRWIQVDGGYKQSMDIPVGHGYRVDLTSDATNRRSLKAPIIAVNDNGDIYAETSNPPSVDILVDVMAVYVKETSI